MNFTQLSYLLLSLSQHAKSCESALPVRAEQQESKARNNAEFSWGFSWISLLQISVLYPRKLESADACQEALWHRSRLKHITPAQVWFEYLRGWGTSLEACGSQLYWLSDRLASTLLLMESGWKKKTPLFDEAIYVERLLLSFPFSLNFCQFVCL